MEIAYIITAYKDPKHLKRLIQSLNYNADFFIHIDKKVNILPFHLELENFNNVYFTSKRYLIHWGSFAQVLAQKELLKTVFQKHKTYNRIVCLSGMDYPIWPNKRIIDEFRSNPMKEYIMAYNLSKSKNKDQINKIRLWHFFRDLNTNKVKIKRLFSGSSRQLMKILPFRKKNRVKIGNEYKDIYMGSDYWALTYSCAKYVYDKMNSEKALMRYFKYSYVPSEMCIQTIVFNSTEYSTSAILSPDDYLGLKHLTPLHYIEYGKEIKTFNNNDFDVLIKSDKMLFRKASTGISDELLNRIDNTRNKT